MFAGGAPLVQLTALPQTPIWRCGRKKRLNNGQENEKGEERERGKREKHKGG